MFETVTGILIECWEILVESAPYVLFGFLAAGLLKALLPEETVARHLGKNSAASVLKASLFGIPLPLCSCGVISRRPSVCASREPVRGHPQHSWFRCPKRESTPSPSPGPCSTPS